MTFTAIWNDTLATNASAAYSYSYGILSTDKDTNVDGVDITYDPIIAGADEGQNEFWIQSGDDTNEGIFIYIDRTSKVDREIYFGGFVMNYKKIY